MHFFDSETIFMARIPFMDKYSSRLILHNILSKRLQLLWLSPCIITGESGR